jgi:hypothetical protein
MNKSEFLIIKILVKYKSIALPMLSRASTKIVLPTFIGLLIVLCTRILPAQTVPEKIPLAGTTGAGYEARGEKAGGSDTGSHQTIEDAQFAQTPERPGGRHTALHGRTIGRIH